MNVQGTSDTVGSSQAEQDRAERFLATFNCIQKHLREKLNQDSDARFLDLVRDYSAQHSGWRGARILPDMARLRNLLVHEQYRPRDYLAIPSEKTVRTIEQVRDGLLHPERVIPKYQKEVAQVDVADTLAHVLNLIAEHAFSQFPVYTGEQFCGLLTENGITRWLAHHSRNTDTLVELAEVPVQDLLGEEENRSNHRFVPRDMLVDDLITQFGRQPLLEAVLITATGASKQSLLGIVSRWDILSAVE